MRKIHVLLGTLFACTVVGCGQDPNDKIISETISAMQETTRSIEVITGLVSGEVETAKKTSKPRDEKKLLEAKAEADKLKEKAVKLQGIKSQTDSIRDVLTKEQKDELAKKHKAPFQQAANDLYNAEKKLEAALKDAKALATTPGVSKTALEDLQKALENSQKEFAVMNKK